MEKFMFGIFSILTTDLVLHFLGLCFVVLAGMLLYYAAHCD